MKAGIALFAAALIFVPLVIYFGTYPMRVSWEVVSEDNKVKYIEVLKKQTIPFSEETDHLGRRWITVKGYSIEELETLTKEYDEWVDAKYKNQGAEGYGE
jgi:hypothetical protein